MRVFATKSPVASCLLLVTTLLVGHAHAFNLLQPGDPIIAIDVPGLTSSYPGAESPALGLDGDTSTKYLNFGEVNSGFILELPSAVTPQSFQFVSGNDAPERDPTSWEIYGFNGTVSEVDNGRGLADPWVSIASGTDTGLNGLVEPARTTAGTLQSFTNTTAYNAFKMIFPSVRNEATANSMQFTDVAFYTDTAGTQLLTAIPNKILAIDADPAASASAYPAGEAPPLAIDGDISTKYLNFGDVGSGFIVTPAGGGSPFNQLRLTTANDAPERDPLMFELYGTNDPIVSADNSGGEDENWTLIDSGATGLATDPGRDTPGPIVSVSSPTAYSSYKVIFPELRDASPCCMQIAEVEFLAPDLVSLEVNRDTGVVTIVAASDAGQNVTFESYAINSSTSGAINDENWASITDGNSDPNDTWTIVSAAGDRMVVAEEDVAGSGADDGFTLTPGSSISLGAIWDRVPENLQDVTLVLLDSTGSRIPADVDYTGGVVKPGDYTGDGQVTLADWPQFQEHYGADLSGLTLAEAYLAGDLDADFDNDIDDYNLFVKAAGGYEALFAVPEPSGLAMLGGLSLVLLGSRRMRRHRRLLARATLPCLGLIVAAGSMALVDTAQAQTGLNFATTGGTPTFSIPSNETNEGGTIGDAASGNGPANLFDDTLVGATIDLDLFYWDYGTTDPPNGGSGSQYASLGDEDGDGTFDPKTFFMDYGSPVSANWFAYAPRLGGDALADRIGKFEFWFSNTSFNQTVPTTEPDVVFTLLDGDSRLADNVLRPYPLGDTQSGQYVATRMTLSGDSAQRPANNPGGHEFRLMTGTSAPIIEVDRSTGEITLLNTGDASGNLTLQSYTIESPGNGLVADGFNGLGDDAGFPAGNGTGNGWEIGGGTHNGRLAESFFSGDSTLTAGNTGISLGNAYATNRNTEDLIFKWTNGEVVTTNNPQANSVVYDGIVRYVGTPVVTVQCDADGDNDCILDDIDAMYALAGQPGQFDYTNDNVIDANDINGWLAEASTTANVANPDGRTLAVGDVDLDFQVNSIDLGRLLNNFGTSAGSAAAGPGWGGGDLTMDGSVDSTDLGRLLNNFGFIGSAASAVAVPEPSELSLLLIASFGAVLTMRQKRTA